MLGRNDMKFKEADMVAVKRVVDDFATIAKKMSVNVTTECTVSEDQETLMITVLVDGNEKRFRYTKSIALSWEGTVNKIKAGMLDALTQICPQDISMDVATSQTEPCTPVVFTILQCGHGVYRIITNHMVYRKMNTACITDLAILYETMQEIAQYVSEDCGRAVSFEVMETDNTGSARQLETDRELEKLWEELEDVLFVEDDTMNLVLASPWNGFDAGTDRESIWHWFDERHSKGVGWLLNGKTEADVSLVEIPKSMHEMYEMGITFDRVYRIENENKIPIGMIYLSDAEDNVIYIEWLEVLIAFHGKGYLRKIMVRLASLFHKEIRFECSEDLRSKYMTVGCQEHGINEITGLYQMSYNEGRL